METVFASDCELIRLRRPYDRVDVPGQQRGARFQGHGANKSNVARLSTSRHALHHVVGLNQRTKAKLKSDSEYTAAHIL